MTEQKDSSAMVEETTPAVETRTPPVKKPPRKSGQAGTALGALAIVIALAIGAGLWMNAHHQAQQQAQVSQTLSEQLTALQQ
ncbi:MAG: uroporphyrinogen-III C-methyltransferase, partial [Mixta calida]|nr:uroporphyrinogen-III C-methyltransferase [Mixta calida]